jgi:FkbM family methyltransferase
MTKSLLQRLLKRLGLYDWFKSETFAYDVYSYFKQGRPVDWRSREIRFYRSFVCDGPGTPLIFDIGANRGGKTAEFLKLGARVVAVDPDQANLRLLARKFGNRPVAIVGKAVSERSGAERFWMTSPGSGLNTLTRKWVETLDTNAGKFGAAVEFPSSLEVETTTLGALIETHGPPRYIKIDVEGHEREVLRGLPRPVPYLSFEANLPEFIPETAECIELLGQLSPAGLFNLTSSDTYKGFMLGEWCTGREIASRLGTLGECTVEVYWKSGMPA